MLANVRKIKGLGYLKYGGFMHFLSSVLHRKTIVFFIGGRVVFSAQININDARMPVRIFIA